MIMVLSLKVDFFKKNLVLKAVIMIGEAQVMFVKVFGLYLLYSTTERKKHESLREVYWRLNFACRSVWVRNLVFNIKGGT
jgi:hypothetical protein